MKSLGRMFLFLLTVLLSSCIEGDEEIFLNADGSARLKAVYSLPAIIFSDEDAERMKEQIAKEIGEEEKIILLTNKVEKVNGKQVITIEVETGNLVRLEDLMGDDDLDDDSGDKSEQILDTLLGEFTYQREGLAVGLNRKVDLAPLLDKYVGPRWPSMVGDSEFRYTIHFPKAVKTSNAHESFNGGRTVKWKYKLSDCRETPIELSIVAPIPVPWWLYAGLGCVVVLILVGIWKWVARMKRRAEA